MLSLALVSADTYLKKELKAALEGLPILMGKEAKTYKEAIDHYKEDQHPLLIIDLFLAPQSGLDLVKTLKAANKNICIILILRVRNRLTMEKAFRLGADDIIAWPTDRDTLRSLVLHRMEKLSTDKQHHAKD